MLCLIDKSFNMHKGLPLITTQQFYYVKSLFTSAVSVNVRLQKILNPEIWLIGKNKMLIFFHLQLFNDVCDYTVSAQLFT